MAGDEVNGNNVMESDANNRSNVYTSCTNNNVSETHMDIYIGVCWILLHAVVQSDYEWDWWIRGSYTDGRGPTSRFIVWASVRMCHASRGVYIRWTGSLDWTTGLDYWTLVILCKSVFMTS